MWLGQPWHTANHQRDQKRDVPADDTAASSTNAHTFIETSRGKKMNLVNPPYAVASDLDKINLTAPKEPLSNRTHLSFRSYIVNVAWQQNFLSFSTAEEFP